MFWDNWIPARLLIKPVVCGIEVLISEEGTCYYFTILKKQSNKLEIIEQGVRTSLNDLPARVKKDKMPCVICLNGKGIIIRKITVSENDTIGDEAFFHQYLSGLQLSDFNIQIFPQENSTVFAAVQRKEQWTSLAKDLETALPELTDIYTGVPAILSLTALLSNYNYLQPNLSRVDLQNGFVDQILPATNSNENSQVEVDELKIPSEQLLSFSAAFAYLTGQSLYTTTVAALIQYKNKHIEKNKMKLLVTLFLSVGFGLCLVNFLFFSSYFSQTKKLDTELGLYQDKYDKINELLSNYEKKKSLIEETGLLENYFFSTYTDKIAATIPKDVILTDFVFNPVMESDMAEDSLMNFSKKLLMIRGNCNKSLLINEWVNVLKTQNFIKDVNLEKFSFNNDGNQPNFEIKIVTE